MANSSITPADASAEVKEQIGQAWSQSYHGKADNAIRAFEGILTRWPDHVDANYGMSLALKNAKQPDKAAEGFRKTLQLLTDELTRAQGDDVVRYQMLSRMVEQQLENLKAR